MSDTVAPVAPVKKTPREKSIYMLHDPKTFASIGKFSSSDFRYAANKAASRGFTNILLRKTNTKQVYEFGGAVVDIPPTTVMRGDREIVYSKKPKVSFVRKFIYDGEIPSETENVPVNPRVSESGEITAPKTPRAKKKPVETAPEEETADDAPPAPVKAKKPRVSKPKI
jgi:hypothetical protein